MSMFFANSFPEIKGSINSVLSFVSILKLEWPRKVIFIMGSLFDDTLQFNKINP
jgi:hypothetical protein